MKSIAFIASFASVALSQTLCDQYGYYSQGKYQFNNNAYGEGSQSGQCLYVDSVTATQCAWHVNWNWAGNSAAPLSYPYSGLNFDKPLVSNIKSIPTIAHWKYSNANVRADVSYDLFTAPNQDHPTSYGDYELMIWLAHYDGIEPLGSQIASTTIGGIQWQVWYGTQTVQGTNQKTYSFVATTQQPNFSGNIKPFFTYLTNSHGFPASSQYLITLQFGTEAFSGGPTTFTVNKWSASVNT